MKIRIYVKILPQYVFGIFWSRMESKKNRPLVFFITILPCFPIVIQTWQDNSGVKV